MALNSSNSAFTPCATTLPFCTKNGGSSCNSFSINSIGPIQAFSFSPNSFKLAKSAANKRSRIGPIAIKARFSWATSLGEILAVANLDTNLSRSPICSIPLIQLRKTSSCCVKYNTPACLLSIGAISFRGKANHRFSNLEPIGDEVRSITLINVLALSLFEPNNSRFLAVNLSKTKYCSSSMREMALICFTLSCWVSAK